MNVEDVRLNEIEQVIEIFQHVKKHGKVVNAFHDEQQGDTILWQLGELAAYRDQYACGIHSIPDGNNDSNLSIRLEHAAAWRDADRLFKILTRIIK